MSDCGSPEQFARLLEGQLSAAATQALETHVEACPRCQERLARAAAGAVETNWKLLRPPDQGAAPPADADFLRYLRENPPGAHKIRSAGENKSQVGHQPGFAPNQL